MHYCRKSFYGEIASLVRKSRGEVSALTVRIMIKLLVVSIVPFTLVVCFGPWIFRTFFGAEWVQSGTYARYLCFYLIFRFVYSPISDGIFNVFERQKLVLWLEVSRIVIVTSGLFISYFRNLSAVPPFLSTASVLRSNIYSPSSWSFMFYEQKSWEETPYGADNG